MPTIRMTDPTQLIVISGCSGGGKSTLLSELRRLGYRTAQEPGRRIVQEELANGRDALPWKNMEAFLKRAIEISIEEYRAAKEAGGVTFFDRSLVDAVSGLAHLTGQDLLADMAADYHYDPKVLMAPPWPELFQSDAERRHDFISACAEYERLVRDYQHLGYELVILPKESVDLRAGFVVQSFELSPAS